MSAAEILAVEDSPTQAMRMRYLLEANGYTALIASNGTEALAAIRARPPALVITDVVMPEMDGYALCSAIKSEEVTAAIPVILLTSLSDPKDIVNALECGADNFIQKSSDDEYLLARVAQMLDAFRGLGGTGLGLALCREIVEAHAGRIGSKAASQTGTFAGMKTSLALQN